jgi:hypothetical protein
MLNCKQISKLASDSLDQKLSWGNRMQLWMHLGMCGLCSRFRKAIIRINQETQARSHEVETGQRDDVKLPDPARQRIRKILDSHGQNQ